MGLASPAVSLHIISPPMSDSTPILYCRCAYAQVVPQDVKDQVLADLGEAGANFEAVSDLCEFAAHRDPRLAELKERAESQGLKLVACYPRVVKGLFTQCGQPLPEEKVTFLNMRAQSAEEIREAVGNPGEKTD